MVALSSHRKYPSLWAAFIATHQVNLRITLCRAWKSHLACQQWKLSIKTSFAVDLWIWNTFCILCDTIEERCLDVIIFNLIMATRFSPPRRENFSLLPETLHWIWWHLNNPSWVMQKFNDPIYHSYHSFFLPKLRWNIEKYTANYKMISADSCC